MRSPVNLLHVLAAAAASSAALLAQVPNDDCRPHESSLQPSEVSDPQAPSKIWLQVSKLATPQVVTVREPAAPETYTNQASLPPRAHGQAEDVVAPTLV